MLPPAPKILLNFPLCLHAKFHCSSYRYANSKVPPTSVDAQLGVGSASPNAACASYAVDDDSATSHLAKEELNLLAKLIGSTEAAAAAAGGGGKDTFKLNLFDICRGAPDKKG